MLLHLSVCLQGGLSQCMLGYHPPGTDTPPDSRPPGTRLLLFEQTPRSDNPLEWTSPQHTATATDGMHPIGIHSYFVLYLNIVTLNNCDFIVQYIFTNQQSLLWVSTCPQANFISKWVFLSFSIQLKYIWRKATAKQSLLGKCS